MDLALAHPVGRRPVTLAVALALVATFTAALVGAGPIADAFNAGWTKPKRVFAYNGAPTHATAVDVQGKTHIATERGSTGIWYVTNAGGSWESCQLSDGNDREPSIRVGGGVVHVTFARRDAGAEGLYTASSDQAAGTGGCGWALVERYPGKVSHPSLGLYGGQLSIAFRTGTGRLLFTRGVPGDDAWAILETIDGKCCTSPPSLDLTTGGAPRVAYGDGKRSTDGLKYAVRTGSGWKKSRAAKGRIKQVTLILEKSPGVFTPPSNAPRMMYVKARKGTSYASKASSGAGGSWHTVFIGKFMARPDLRFWSNDELLLYGGKGKYWITVKRAAIQYGQLLTGSGRDVKATLDHDPTSGMNVITFARNKGTKGLYYTRPT